MKTVAKKQNTVIKLASLVAGCIKAPKMASAVMAWLAAQESMETRIARLSKLVANDNNKAISRHLANELAEIMAFTAKKRGVSLDIMTVALCMAMGVGYIGALRDNQFRAALDYVLTYKDQMIA